MDRVCLIAGFGYVGRRLAARLRPAGRIVALVRGAQAVAALQADGIDSIAADLDAGPPTRDLEAVARGAAIFYLAPPPDAGTSDPRV